MSYKEPVSELNVVSIYRQLMDASTDKNSAYIRAKETLLEYFSTGVGKQLSDREKADMLTGLVTSVATSISSHSMDVAVKIAVENRDAPYALGKMRADVEANQASVRKADSEIKLTETKRIKEESDREYTVIRGWKEQAEIYTKYGIDMSGHSLNNALLPTDNNGGVSVANGLATDVIDAKAKAVDMNTRAMAGARKDGVGTLVVGSDGSVNTVLTTSEKQTLTGAQTSVARRQEKAFDDNMRQHAANSAANTIGLIISSGSDGLLDDGDVEIWRSSMRYLNTSVSSDSPAYIMEFDVTSTLVISAAAYADASTTPIVISGTSTNMPWGTNIYARLLDLGTTSATEYTEIFKIQNIIEKNGTWKITLDEDKVITEGNNFLMVVFSAAGISDTSDFTAIA